MDVGIIGLGKMGSAIARSLLRGGHRVVAYNRSPDKAERLVADGATRAHQISDACRGDAVITMLSDDAAVEQVVCGPHGVMSSLAPEKTVHVSMSTISPALVHRLAERHAEQHLQFLSAPVLGRPEAAAQGTLSVLVAGDPQLVDWLRPIFDAIGQKVFFLGATPEGANVVKLACNTLIASLIETLGETLALVTKTGVVDPQQFLDVLLATMLTTPPFRPYAEHLKSGDLEPGFKLPLALKDIQLTLDTGRESAVPLPIVSLIRDHMIEAIATGYGELDWAALALVAQDAAGLPNRVTRH
jgi:3-hydroxyisobutyrate dehydrogenase-like beta-hydroxyacid dehydrogenase